MVDTHRMRRTGGEEAGAIVLPIKVLAMQDLTVTFLLSHLQHSGGIVFAVARSRRSPQTTAGEKLFSMSHSGYSTSPRKVPSEDSSLAEDRDSKWDPHHHYKWASKACGRTWMKKAKAIDCSK